MTLPIDFKWDLAGAIRRDLRAEGVPKSEMARAFADRWAVIENAIDRLGTEAKARFKANPNVAKEFLARLREADDGRSLYR